MTKRGLSFLLSLLLIISLLHPGALTAQAANKPSYVALGDSISTGYGLENKTAQGFSYLLAKEQGFDLTNLAIDGNTAPGVLAQLNAAAVQKTVKKADLITLTIGGNDLMALLYQSIADVYNATQTSDANKITVEDVLPIMNSDSDNRKLTLMMASMSLLDPTNELYLMTSPAFEAALNTYVSNLKQIVSTVKGLNPDVTILVATQYNPYVEFNGAAYIIFDISMIYEGMEAGVTALNNAITANAKNCGYEVADVKSAFDASADDLYVADPVTLELDFHPNAAGHALIAQTMASALPPIDAPETPDVPQTGDSSLLWIALAAICASGMVAISFRRKRAFN